jgi:hypothetical protein
MPVPGEERSMNRFFLIALILLLVLPSGALAAGCRRWGGSGPVPDSAPSLSSDEVHWLTYMREEEKLARDVYLHQNNLWNMPVFSTIAVSEQVHMDAVKILLDRYGLPDPAAGKPEGVFTDPILQKVYNSLTEQGHISRFEALRSGIIVEETDISDLKTAISTAKHSDIRNLYYNLLAGSYPHLCAFRHNLAWY